MKIARAITTCVLLLMLGLSRAAIALPQDPETAPRANGAGAFPLTSVHASAWFGSQSSKNSEKRIIVMIYFAGTPGWHNEDTDFKWDINQDPATISMTVGKAPILVSYSSETGTTNVQGKSFKLTDANVFLVTDIDGPNLEVHALGVHDLTFKSDKNPAIALLQRNSRVRAGLLGKAATSAETEIGEAHLSDAERQDAEGLKYLETGDAEDKRHACMLFRAAAEKGFSESQYRVGYCYQTGFEGDPDLALANEWYKKAALQGHVDAQYKLGHSYRVGRGTEVDMARALEWYKEAADYGDGPAMQNIAWIYGTGQGGVEVDEVSASKWYLLAAQNGETGSQFEIARRFSDGNGIERDVAAAYSWLLVLAGSKNQFRPADWDQIEAQLTSLEKALTAEQKEYARVEADAMLRGLATRYIEKLGK